MELLTPWFQRLYKISHFQDYLKIYKCINTCFKFDRKRYKAHIPANIVCFVTILLQRYAEY